MDIGMPRMESKTRAPITESRIRLRPTIATMHWLLRISMSATGVKCSINCGLSSSIVTETDTSDVVIRSTEISSSSKIANSRARKPCAPSILFDVMCTTVIPLFTATALGPASTRVSPSSVINVPGLAMLCVLRTRTGIFCATAGAIVRGCRTFAPNHASSAASTYEMRSTTRALGIKRGSQVIMPSTSVQI